MGYGQFGPLDLWGEICDWLEPHWVDVPTHLPGDKRK